MFGIGKGFLMNLLLTSQKLLRKRMVLFFFGTINKGEAHSEAGCLSSAPSLTNLSTSLIRVSLCIFCTGKGWPWYRDTPSFSWKETGFVFQSPKVPSKSDSYLLTSCSKFFCWSALRRLQLSLTTDWRSALLYLASRICIARLVASYVLCSFMARLWLCFNAQRMLEPCRSLMFLIGKMISSMDIILSLKLKMIMVSVPRMGSYCCLISLAYSTTSGSAWNLLLSEYLKKFSSTRALCRV